MDKTVLNPKADIAFKSGGAQHFFGYYNLCPWDKVGGRLLAHEADFMDRLPDGRDVAGIGFFRPKAGSRFEKLAETRAWNWQQGAMLQWLGPDENRYFIYNDIANNQFVSVIFDTIAKKAEKIVPFPIYAVHPSGEYALSLNFSRLDKLREGYGYKGVKNESNESQDGIYFVNLKNGESELIAPFDYLKRNQPASSMNEGEHWIDHIAFNPSGTMFAFLHRWEMKNSGMHSRLCVAGFKDGSPNQPMVLLDSGTASHFTWEDNNKLLIWGRPKSTVSAIGASKIVRKTLLPIYHAFIHSSGLRQGISGDAFLGFEIQDEANNFEYLGKIADGIIKEDGHATFSPDKNWLLTDTYPDKNHERSLDLYNLEKKKLINVGHFNSLPPGVAVDWDLSAMRCDLHPRWSRDGRKICIDSVHEGLRQMYVLDVKDILI